MYIKREREREKKKKEKKTKIELLPNKNWKTTQTIQSIFYFLLFPYVFLLLSINLQLLDYCLNDYNLSLI